MNEPNKALEPRRLLVTNRAFSPLRGGTIRAKQSSGSALTLGVIERMEIPERFNGYRCSDYFASFTQGVWSELEHMWLIVPADEVAEQSEREFLVVGRAGVDGIEFGYRRGHDGIWAHYPIERDFRLVAPSVSALVEGWLGGSIRV